MNGERSLSESVTFCAAHPAEPEPCARCEVFTHVCTIAADKLAERRRLRLEGRQP